MLGRSIAWLFGVRRAAKRIFVRKTSEGYFQDLLVYAHVSKVGNGVGFTGRVSSAYPPLINGLCRRNSLITSDAVNLTIPPMDLFRTDLPTTILAGAGVSAVAPTCLPGWWALNDAVLQALGDAVDRVTGRSGLSNDFRNVVAERRDSTPFLKPDLQAQLIEDEIGDAYFSALAYVDSAFVNSIHELIAELARQGRVGAIITTNFDCTIERALDAAGLDYVSYASPEEFEGLASHSLGVALVKVHGSSNQPSTMVDTLRQRLHGRPAGLNKWVQSQFVKFPTIAMGFSGEDLQYDQNYLTIRPAAIIAAAYRGPE